MPVSAPVAGAHVAEAQADDEQHHRNLDHHDGRIKARALLDADGQNRRDDQGNHEGRHVPAYLDSKIFGASSSSCAPSNSCGDCAAMMSVTRLRKA